MKRKTKILITGINGFVGHALFDSLAAKKYDVYGLDFNTINTANCSRLIDFYKVDIANEFKLEPFFDFVFHFAAFNQTHVGKGTYDNYHSINVIGTENLIKALMFDNFVFMSTAKVYKQYGRPITEFSEVEPAANYEKSKLEAEQICRKYIAENKLTIFRPVNIAGFGQANKALLPVFFQKAILNQTINVFAPKKTVLQLLYIKDVIRAFELLIEKGGVPGTYNLSSKDNMCIDELAFKIVEITVSKSKIEFTNLEEVAFSEVLAQEAKNNLNWEPKTKINDILKIYYKDTLSRSNN